MVARGLLAQGIGDGGVGVDGVCVCVCVSFISWPHTGTKCTSGLFSCVQGSVSCSPKPRKLQSSQAENRSGIWTTGFTCLRPRAHKVTPPQRRKALNCYMKQCYMSIEVCRRVCVHIMVQNMQYIYCIVIHS